MSTPATPTREAELERPAPTCPRCNAALAPDQRYCLNCGHRLSGPRVDYRSALGLQPESSANARQPSGGRDNRSALIALAGIATIVLAVGVGVVIGRDNGSSASNAKSIAVTVAGSGTGAPAAAAGSGSAASGSAGAGSVTDAWPAGGSGWTVELSSLDNATAGASDVKAAETAATAKGAKSVGVLNGDQHSGTPTGKYVIYSGRFSSRSKAQASVHSLAGPFPGALVLHVTPKGSGSHSNAGSSSGGGSNQTAGSAGAAQAQSLHKLSGSAYTKASQKLPPSVGTGGAPPPADNKKAGGGTSGSCIGC